MGTPRNQDTTAPVPAARRSASASRRGRRRGSPAQRAVAIVAFLVLAVGKTETYRHLIEHRAGLIPLFAVALAVSILRTRPIATSVTAGGLIALALDPHPLLAGVGLAVGLIALLIALSFVVATILHARQPTD